MVAFEKELKDFVVDKKSAHDDLEELARRQSRLMQQIELGDLGIKSDRLEQGQRSLMMMTSMVNPASPFSASAAVLGGGGGRVGTAGASAWRNSGKSGKENSIDDRSSVANNLVPGRDTADQARLLRRYCWARFVFQFLLQNFNMYPF